MLAWPFQQEMGSMFSISDYVIQVASGPNNPVELVLDVFEFIFI